MFLGLQGRGPPLLTAAQGLYMSESGPVSTAVIVERFHLIDVTAITNCLVFRPIKSLSK